MNDLLYDAFAKYGIARVMSAAAEPHQFTAILTDEQVEALEEEHACNAVRVEKLRADVAKINGEIDALHSINRTISEQLTGSYQAKRDARMARIREDF